MKETPCCIGRARTVLTFGRSDQAVLSSVAARKTIARNNRLRVVGPVSLHHKSMAHIEEVVLPIVDRVSRLLGQPQNKFEISIDNLNAAAAHDLDCEISGYSMDTAVFLAMLSAVVEIPIPQNLCFTGQLSSMDGRLAVVKGLPAKVEAALSQPAVTEFVCPSLAADNSLEVLSSGEKERIETALLRAREKMKITQTRDIAELVKTGFPEEHIVVPSLQKGFFETGGFNDSALDPIEKAACYLAKNGEERFWRFLERHLLDGDHSQTKRLLAAYSDYHQKRKRYPRNFGRKLHELLHGLPTVTRRCKTVFPLLKPREVIQLSRWATERDHDDIPLLYDAAAGKITETREAVPSASSSPATAQNPARQKLEALLSEIGKENLAHYTREIDAAAASYHTDSITVDTQEELNEAITSYWIHLSRHFKGAGSVPTGSQATADALALLERAYSKRGGLPAAVAEAKDGINGGMRTIFNLMTDQLRVEEQTKYIEMVFRETLDVLEWQEKVDLVASLLDRLDLPAELRSTPPERLARHWELLVQTHIHATDSMKDLIRTL